MQARSLSFSHARTQTDSSFLPIAEGPGLAHDAGNLIGALGLYCDLLEMPGVLQDRHSHYAAEIRLLAQRSNALIHRLLEHLPASPALHEYSRPEIVTCAFAPLLRSLTAPDVELFLDIESGLPRLPFSAEVLERILVNLTRNAAAALRRTRLSRRTAEPARVHILLSGDATHLHLRVRDNGPGMSAHRAASFLHPCPLREGATKGLGHRVVHELVQSTGGLLSLSTSRTQGTEITIDWTVPQTSP